MPVWVYGSCTQVFGEVVRRSIVKGKRRGIDGGAITSTIQIYIYVQTRMLGRRVTKYIGYQDNICRLPNMYALPHD